MMLLKAFTVPVFLIYFVQFASPCNNIISSTNVANDSVPFSKRAYWMREANKLLSAHGSPCPLYPFAAVVVNHTANGLGELVCVGVNQISTTGNPTMHGEMVAIDNCSAILTDKNGRFRLSPGDALSAFTQLSIYSNAESCPMCAAAIRWTGFKEYIYGTSIGTLIKHGWNQIRIGSDKIFSASTDLTTTTAYIASVLNNETDPYFMWQHNPMYPCPLGCRRYGSDNICQP